MIRLGCLLVAIASNLFINAYKLQLARVTAAGRPQSCAQSTGHPSVTCADAGSLVMSGILELFGAPSRYSYVGSHIHQTEECPRPGKLSGRQFIF